jgi:hypothetical protein
MNIFLKQSWSPYAAGAVAGVVLCLSVLVAGKFVGASTTYVRSVGLLEQTVAAEHVENSPYFSKTKVKVDWQMMFVVGLLLGSLVSSFIAKDFKVTPVPPMWEKRFGNSLGKRFAVAFLGGIAVLFGARLAGG